MTVKESFKKWSNKEYGKVKETDSYTQSPMTPQAVRAHTEKAYTAGHKEGCKETLENLQSQSKYISSDKYSDYPSKYFELQDLIDTELKKMEEE